MYMYTCTCISTPVAVERLQSCSTSMFVMHLQCFMPMCYVIVSGQGNEHLQT